MIDYIDRVALGISLCNRDVFENKGYADGWNAAVKILKSAPAVDVQKIKHGKWIKMDIIPDDPDYFCSECRNFIDVATGKVTPIERGLLYCPNCGAKMDGGDNNA